MKNFKDYLEKNNLKEDFLSFSSCLWEDCDITDPLPNECYDKLKQDGIELELIEVNGGCEGSGEEFWVVYKVTKGGRSTLFMVDGSYYSYEGTTCHDIDEVEERQKLVIYYEKV